MLIEVSAGYGRVKGDEIVLYVTDETEILEREGDMG